MSLSRVFKSGAGWFWKDSQFRGAGLAVERSSPDEIAKYTQEMILRSKNNFSPIREQCEIQTKYMDAFASAMGDLGEKWHGEVRARMCRNFLETHGDWFLGQ
jgi:hypothetical protein